MAGPGLGSKNKQRLGSKGSPLLKGAGIKQPAKGLSSVYFKTPVPAITSPSSFRQLSRNCPTTSFLETYVNALARVTPTFRQYLVEELINYARLTTTSIVPGSYFILGSPFQTTDEAASNLLIRVAKGQTTLFGIISSNKLANIDLLTESQKDKLIAVDPNNLFPIVLYELATARGRNQWVFDEWSNVTRAYYSDWVPNEVLDGFIHEVNRRRLTYEFYFKEYKSTNGDSSKRIAISLRFSPFQGISISDVWGRHANAYANNNWVRLLIAGAVAFVYPSPLDGWADVYIHADVSRTSLMLHIARSYDRDAFKLIYGHIPPLATVKISLRTKLAISPDYFTTKE